MSTAREGSHLWPGVPLALAAAVLFGGTLPLSKLLLEAVNPFMLAGLLYLGGGLGLAVYHLSLKAVWAAAREAPLRRADVPWLALAVGAGGIVAPVLLMFGLTLTPASSGALLLNLEGLATMAIAWLVYRENVNWVLLLGAASILSGAALLSWDGQGLVFDSGAMLVAGACLAWGLDNNFTRKISSADPAVIAMIKGLAAGSINVALAFLMGASLPTPATITAAGVTGLLGVGVSLVMYILALRHLGTARAGAYYSTAPFVGAVLAIALLSEPVALKVPIAGALMGIGLWLHLAERHDHEHEHEALEHDHSHVHDRHHQHRHDGPVTEPHSHWHRHEPIRHAHVHYPDLHHRHRH